MCGGGRGRCGRHTIHAPAQEGGLEGNALSSCLRRGEGEQGIELSMHLHQPLLIAWPYLMTALRHNYKRQVANNITSSSLAFTSFDVSLCLICFPFFDSPFARGHVIYTI